MLGDHLDEELSGRCTLALVDGLGTVDGGEGGANLAGVVRTSIDPVPTLDYLEGGTVDTDD